MTPSAALYLAFLFLAAGCRARKVQGPAAEPEPEWKIAGCRETAHAQVREMQEADQLGGGQLLFLGDSITELWRGTICSNPCHPVLQLHCDEFGGLMQRYFGQYNPAVQAVAGDHVEHLMWRMRNGALPTQHQPKVVVLLIGVNDLSNLGFNAPGAASFQRKLTRVAPTVADRIQEAVGLLLERLPRAQVLLLGLLPVGIWGLPGQAIYTWPSPYVQALPIVNDRLRTFAATQPRVQFLDCGERFFNADRTAIDGTLLPDELHPSARGMERGIVQCIKPLVDLLMLV